MRSRRSDAEATERLFAALVPPAELRTALHARALELLAPVASQLRIPAAPSLHVTLRFFGDVDADAASALEHELRGRLDGAPAPELVLDATGAFGGSRPRVLWLGVDDRTAPRLRELAARAERAAVASGLAPETRAHRPHVTLARVRPRAARLALPAGFAAWRPCAPWRPDRAVLLRSTRAAGGVRYEARASYPLAG